MGLGSWLRGKGWNGDSSAATTTAPVTMPTPATPPLAIELPTEEPSWSLPRHPDIVFTVEEPATPSGLHSIAREVAHQTVPDTLPNARIFRDYLSGQFNVPINRQGGAKLATISPSEWKELGFTEEHLPIYHRAWKKYASVADDLFPASIHARGNINDRETLDYIQRTPTKVGELLAAHYASAEQALQHPHLAPLIVRPQEGMTSFYPIKALGDDQHLLKIYEGMCLPPHQAPDMRQLCDLFTNEPPLAESRMKKLLSLGHAALPSASGIDGAIVSNWFDQEAVSPHYGAYRNARSTLNKNLTNLLYHSENSIAAGAAPAEWAAFHRQHLGALSNTHVTELLRNYHAENADIFAPCVNPELAQSTHEATRAALAETANLAHTETKISAAPAHVKPPVTHPPIEIVAPPLLTEPPVAVAEPIAINAEHFAAPAHVEPPVPPAPPVAIPPIETAVPPLFTESPAVPTEPAAPSRFNADGTIKLEPKKMASRATIGHHRDFIPHHQHDTYPALREGENLTLLSDLPKAEAEQRMANLADNDGIVHVSREDVAEATNQLKRSGSKLENAAKGTPFHAEYKIHTSVANAAPMRTLDELKDWAKQHGKDIHFADHVHAAPTAPLPPTTEVFHPEDFFASHAQPAHNFKRNLALKQGGSLTPLTQLTADGIEARMASLATGEGIVPLDRVVSDGTPMGYMERKKVTPVTDFKHIPEQHLGFDASPPIEEAVIAAESTATTPLVQTEGRFAKLARNVEAAGEHLGASAHSFGKVVGTSAGVIATLHAIKSINEAKKEGQEVGNGTKMELIAGLLAAAGSLSLRR